MDTPETTDYEKVEIRNLLHPSWLPFCIILGILRIILGIAQLIFQNAPPQQLSGWARSLRGCAWTLRSLEWREASYLI